MTARIQTVRASLRVPEQGVLLPHEHLFLDLRGPEAPGYAQADPEAVYAILCPLIEELKTQHVVALIECSTVGVGRNVTMLASLAEATGLDIVAPTGVYSEPSAPRTMLAMSERDLETWMSEEIQTSIEGTPIRAGFIKLASSPQGLTCFERRVLRAAGRVADATGVAIASHTITGAAALDQLDILEGEGVSAERFVWVHAHMEPDRGFHREAARRGAYVEFDNIGAHLAGANNMFPSFALADETAIDLVTDMVDAGFADHVLLSQDAGWYNAGLPLGGRPRGFTYLLETFVPLLTAAGLGDTVRVIVERNPWQAFARRCPDSGEAE